MKRYFFVLIFLILYFASFSEYKTENHRSESNHEKASFFLELEYGIDGKIEATQKEKQPLFVCFLGSIMQTALFLFDSFIDFKNCKWEFASIKEKFRPQSARLYIISDSDESNAIMVL